MFVCSLIFTKVYQYSYCEHGDGRGEANKGVKHRECEEEEGGTEVLCAHRNNANNVNNVW